MSVKYEGQNSFVKTNPSFDGTSITSSLVSPKIVALQVICLIPIFLKFYWLIILLLLFLYTIRKQKVNERTQKM
jgi:hypothetical protein